MLCRLRTFRNFRFPEFLQRAPNATASNSVNTLLWTASAAINVTTSVTITVVVLRSAQLVHTLCARQLMCRVAATTAIKFTPPLHINHDRPQATHCCVCRPCWPRGKVSKVKRTPRPVKMIGYPAFEGEENGAESIQRMLQRPRSLRRRKLRKRKFDSAVPLSGRLRIISGHI